MINHLRRRLRHEQCRETPSSSDHSSGDDSDNNYQPSSRTPPSESFSCDKKRNSRWKGKSPSHKGLGNNVISRALNQISKSPFTHRIEVERLPRQFTQPTFTI